MRHGRLTAVLAGAVAACGVLALAGAPDAGAALVSARAVPAAGTWGSAVTVPGLPALNASGRAEVLSVSCGEAGNCAAGGSYQDGHRHLQGFVVSEQDGTWGRAIVVPGLAGLNAGGIAETLSVSCGAAGDGGAAGGCAAGGYYYGRHAQQGFVASEQGGTWSRAIGLPGLAALNTGGFAEVLSVSCGLAGNCVAGGYYYNRLGQQGFLASERNGTWGKAIAVPGLAALNAGGAAEVATVSCDQAGDCGAGGYYQDRRNHHQGFVVAARNGTWGKAIGVPGLTTLNTGGQAGTNSVSCTSAGYCAAGGTYKNKSGQQGFVVAEQNGIWGKATGIPGLATLNAGGAAVASVTCTSAGNCAAGGGYKDHHGHGQGFVASEQGGTWSAALKVPGLVALNADGRASVSAVSCSQAGDCAAGGSYLDGEHNQEGFVVSEDGGTWGNATELPGLAALNSGVAQVWSVSCGQAGPCVAGGYYQDRHRKTQGLLSSQT